MMDVTKPLAKMLVDEDNDTAINFLDSVPLNPRYQGAIGRSTTKAKLIK